MGNKFDNGNLFYTLNVSVNEAAYVMAKQGVERDVLVIILIFLRSYEWE